MGLSSAALRTLAQFSPQGLGVVCDTMPSVRCMALQRASEAASSFASSLPATWEQFDGRRREYKELLQSVGCDSFGAVCSVMLLAGLAVGAPPRDFLLEAET